MKGRLELNAIQNKRIITNHTDFQGHHINWSVIGLKPGSGKTMTSGVSKQDPLAMRVKSNKNSC